MNPKNSLKLLTIRFDQPQYDLESFMTEDERAFCSKLEVLIKDSIDDSLFVESYDVLHFKNANIILEPVSVKDSDGCNWFKIETNVQLDYDQSIRRFCQMGTRIQTEA